MDCGVDISHRRSIAKRCEPCSEARNKQLAKNHYWENREQKLQYMARRRQTPEFKRVNQEWHEWNPRKVQASRERLKQRHRENTGYNPEGRTCENCYADISDRGHRAKRCVSCSTRPAMKCLVCGADIGKRGPSKFCSEQCKVHDRQLKDSMGHTMVCTKCKETKEYSEFRAHYNSRDSVCKSCEANAARAYAGNLPIQERQRRRRIQGQRERDKKANLPPEQKILLRTKARKALIQKLYGDEFDEYDLYLQQEGECAICRTARSFKRGESNEETRVASDNCLELDHDHVTGRPRGLLCKNCNLKLLPRYERFPSQHQDSPYLNAYLKRGKQL